MDDIAIVMRRRALEWAPRKESTEEIAAMGIELAGEYTIAANEIEYLRGRLDAAPNSDLPPVFKLPEGTSWDGEWWAETLEGKERQRYQTLVQGLMVADRAQMAQIAREIFQLGWKEGCEMGEM